MYVSIFAVRTEANLKSYKLIFRGRDCELKVVHARLSSLRLDVDVIYVHVEPILQKLDVNDSVIVACCFVVGTQTLNFQKNLRWPWTPPTEVF